MSNIIFAKPRHNYDSYQDLYELIRLSGFPLIHFDEIDPASDNTYIMTMVNGENQNGWQQPKARIILWDLEWRPERPAIPGVSEVWASDPFYAQKNECRFVLLGSHPGLNPNPADRNGEYDYDVAMLAYMIPRRDQVKSWMRANALRIAGNAWGDERHRILSRSLMMVHVHQWDEYPCIAPQRFVMAAAYKLPLLSEDVRCHIPELQNGVIYHRFGRLADAAMHATRQADLQSVGGELYQALCIDRPFRREVEAAL